MRGERLAVGERAQPGVLLAARAAQVRHQLLVELLRPPGQALVLPVRRQQHVRGVGPVAAPVRTQAAFEVDDRIEVVVGEHDAPSNRPGGDLSQIEGKGQRRRPLLGRPEAGQIVGGQQRPRPGEHLPRLRPLLDHRRNTFAAFGGQVEIAPVDAKIVAVLGQHGLFERSHAEHIEPPEAEPGPRDGLVGGIDNDVGGGVDINGGLVRPSVGGSRFPNDVSHRSRERIQILR